MQEIILVEKWVWMQESWKDELSSLSLAIYVCHPRYFSWTSWLHQKFPLVILALLLCFLPSLFLLVALYLFFDFLKERRLKKLFCSHFPRIHANQKFAPHFSLFCLKESARKLSWVFPQVHRFTHQKKAHFFFIFSQRNQKTLSSSLPFFYEWFYVYFSPQET